MELPINTFVVCPAIVGRTAELAALRAIVGEVERGHSRVVLLSGEAGIGKSRLLAAIETEAHSRGFSVAGQLLSTGPCLPLCTLA
jgi:DNA replication protein DnaC